MRRPPTSPMKIETDSLAFKVTALTLAAALLPLTGLLIFAVTRSSSALTDTMSQELQEKSALVAHNIDRFIEQRTVDIKVLSQADVLEGGDLRSTEKYLEEILIENLALSDIQLIDLDGRVVAAAAGKGALGKTLEEVLPAAQPLFEAALAARHGDVFFTEVLELEYEYDLILLTPVTDDTNSQVVKVVAAQVSTGPISEIVNVERSTTGNKYVHVIDRDNKVIVTQDQTVNPLEHFPDLRGAPELVDELTVRENPGNTTYVDAYGDPVMAGFAHVQHWGENNALGWTVIAVAPIEQITRPANETRNVIVLFALIVAIPTALIAIRLAHGISQPLRSLVESMVEFGRGSTREIPQVTGGTREVRELSSAFTDMIADRRAVEEQLAQAQRMDAVSQLMGGVAHDFNNLLAVIVGNLELLRDEVDADSKVLVEQAASAADRGAMLTHRLLAFSRKQPLRPKTTDLNGLVEGMMDLLGRTLGESIEVEPHLAGGLWKAVVDPGQLETALLNLAINARDAMRSNGRLVVETANLRLDASDIDEGEDLKPGEYVMIAMRDTGEGMTEDVLERAFEPFFTTKGRGRGLGLSMVFGFIKQSGGHIQIKSEPAEGTTVRMYLPRAAEAKARKDVGDAPKTSPRGIGEKILVVEDEDHVRDLIVRLLNRLGYQPIEAKNGPTALAMLRDNPDIDLLLTDLGLPGGISGANLAREARRQWPHLKVIYISGYSEHAARYRGRIDENIELIQKPFKKEQLARSIRATLEA